MPGDMANYKFIDHTADVEFVAYGRTIEQLFGNALLALFDTISYLNRLKASKARSRTVEIKAKAGNTTELLWSALQDALSKAEAEGLFAYRVTGITIKQRAGEYSFSARCYAKRKSVGLAKFDVKGVSLFDMRIKGERTLEANVVLDEGCSVSKTNL